MRGGRRIVFGNDRYLQRGATLIEHVVAVVILAIGVASVLNLLVVGYLSSAMARDMSVGTGLAQRLLEEARAAGWDAAVPRPRQPVQSSASGYEWQLDVLERAAGLKEVTASVYWRTRGRERSVSLVTLVRRP